MLWCWHVGLLAHKINENLVKTCFAVSPWAIVVGPSSKRYTSNHPSPMIGENRQLLTNEPVEVEKQPVEVQDCRKITDNFKRIYRTYPNLIEEKRRMSTCNRLDLQTLGSQPVMPKNLPDHCPNRIESAVNTKLPTIGPTTVIFNHQLTIYSFCRVGGWECGQMGHVGSTSWGSVVATCTPCVRASGVTPRVNSGSEGPLSLLPSLCPDAPFCPPPYSPSQSGASTAGAPLLVTNLLNCLPTSSVPGLKWAHAFQCEGLQSNHTSLELSNIFATFHQVKNY